MTDPFLVGLSVGSMIGVGGMVAVALAGKRRDELAAQLEQMRRAKRATGDAIDAKIANRQAELRAKNEAGCRRIIPPQGGSGIAPPVAERAERARRDAEDSPAMLWQVYGEPVG